MPATASPHADALAALSADFLHAFGESMPYDSFGTERPDGTPWETKGRWYVREGGKTKRIKNPKDAGGGGGGGEPPAAPAPAAPSAPAGPAAPQVARTGVTPKGVRIKLNPYKPPALAMPTKPPTADDLAPK